MAEILYLCDGKACESCNDKMGGECKHTQDIKHAKSFVFKDGYYFEPDKGYSCVPAKKELDTNSYKIGSKVRHYLGLHEGVVCGISFLPTLYRNIPMLHLDIETDNKIYTNWPSEYWSLIDEDTAYE